MHSARHPGAAHPTRQASCVSLHTGDMAASPDAPSALLPRSRSSSSGALPQLPAKGVPDQHATSCPGVDRSPCSHLESVGSSFELLNNHIQLRRVQAVNRAAVHLLGAVGHLLTDIGRRFRRYFLQQSSTPWSSTGASTLRGMCLLSSATLDRPLQEGHLDARAGRRVSLVQVMGDCQAL